MSLDLLLRITTTGLALVLSVTPAEAGSRSHSQKMHVRFLATGTLIRGNWGPNQDTYLAEFTDDALLLVRLIDEYPNEYPPIPTEVLTSPSGTVLRVRRDAQCDRPFSQLLLRAAPGDLMALIRGKLTYTPKFDKVPEADAIVPCYRVVR